MPGLDNLWATAVLGIQGDHIVAVDVSVEVVSVTLCLWYVVVVALLAAVAMAVLVRHFREWVCFLDFG